VHYHFVRERVLSREMELKHVPTDRQVADIFTKPLGLDKLRQFSGALGLRHLDVPNLRGRVEPEPELDRSEEAESESGVDSEMSNQPRPRRIRKTQRMRQDHNSKEAVKGRMGQDVDQKGGRCQPEDRCRPKGRCRLEESMPAKRMADAE
jgi:hypothetical protein